jgi:hypothetical protein
MVVPAISRLQSMTILLYTFTACALLGIAHRFVRRLSPLTALVLALLPLLFTGRAMLTGGVYAPVELPQFTEPLATVALPHHLRIHNIQLTDLPTQMLPWRQAVHAALARGEWPLWNRYELAGDILAGAAQPAVYYPFTLLAFLLPAAVSFTYTGSITFLLAALAAFLFARELGCSVSASLTASLGWMFCSPLAFFVLWPIGASWAVLPLVLLGARLCVREPSIRSAAILTTAFSLLLLAGHPETALHVIGIGVVYGAWEFFTWKRDMPRALAAALGAGVVALLICAIYLLPLLEVVPQTVEHQFRTEVFARQSRGSTPAGIGARLLTTFFPFLEQRDWRNPAVGNVATDQSAAGSIILAAAIFALWRSRRKERWFFAATFVYTLAVAVQFGPAMMLLQKLPMYEIALNERLYFAAAFALTMLAAFGVDLLQDRDERRRFAWVACSTFIVLAAGSWWITHAALVEGPPLDYGTLRLAGDLLPLGVAAALFLLPLPRKATLACLLVLLAAQRTAEEGRVIPTFAREIAYPPVPLFAPLQNIREPFRIVAQGDRFLPDTAAYYGLEDVRGYQALTMSRRAETYPLWCVRQPVWFNRVDDLTRPFLSFLNVRYAIVGEADPTPPGWREVSRQPRSRLLENLHVLPRAFVPERVRRGAPHSQALSEMLDEVDFGKHSWISSTAEPSGDYENGPGRVAIERIPLGYSLTADMQQRGWLLVSETAWQGWRAYIDGRRVRLSYGNEAFVAVNVPQGHHVVRVIYWPSSFVIGRAITFATLLALVLAIVIVRLRRRREHVTAQE